MASVGCGMKRVQREGVRCGHEEQLFGAHEDVSAEQLDQRAVRRRQPGCVQQLRPQVGVHQVHLGAQLCQVGRDRRKVLQLPRRSSRSRRRRPAAAAAAAACSRAAPPNCSNDNK